MKNILFALQQVLQEINQGTDNISGYSMKMKLLWDQLDSIDLLSSCCCTNCTTGLTKKLVKSQEDRVLIQFLMKLYERYEIIRGNILIMNPLPSISQVYRLSMHEENHKKLYQYQSLTETECMTFAINRRRFQEKCQEKYKLY